MNDEKNSDWDEIDWRDESGVIAFREWKRLREEHKKLRIFFDCHGHFLKLCRDGRGLLEEFVCHCSEENYDEYTNHIINCHTCFVHVPSKTEIEMEILSLSKEYGMTPYEFYEKYRKEGNDWFYNNGDGGFESNWVYYLYESYVEDLPKEPTVMFPVELVSDIPYSKNDGFVTATWTYVCVNCFKRFYHYAVSKPSPINIKLMDCCGSPMVKFERRLMRDTDMPSKKPKKKTKKPTYKRIKRPDGGVTYTRRK